MTQYGDSESVTFVKMALAREFRRGCSNSGRDGGAVRAHSSLLPSLLGAALN